MLEKKRKIKALKALKQKTRYVWCIQKLKTIKNLQKSTYSPNNKKQCTTNVYAIRNVPQVFVDIEIHQVRRG